ncbi:MAG: hypothetical protein LBC74_01040 [Planctomycetaceae bacterium]|jgi:acyl carrier protein|nr:hypothetical protein [Planctomycetaceae bacterium]
MNNYPNDNVPLYYDSEIEQMYVTKKVIEILAQELKDFGVTADTITLNSTIQSLIGNNTITQQSEKEEKVFDIYDLCEIIFKIEKEFGINLNESDIHEDMEEKTVRDWVLMILPKRTWTKLTLKAIRKIPKKIKYVVSALGSWILYGGVEGFAPENFKESKKDAFVPDEIVQECVEKIHSGPCSHCGRTGAVDVQYSYRVMSFFIITLRSTNPIIACRSCGLKTKFGGLFTTFFLGWWGIPFGLILTPIYLMLNIFALFSYPNPNRPSKKLEIFVRNLYRSMQNEEISIDEKQI